MRSATVFLALAATLASAADKAKSPLEEFNVIAGSVALRERGKHIPPSPPPCAWARVLRSLLSPANPGTVRQ